MESIAQHPPAAVLNRRQQNMSRPINMLPNELLANIIVYVHRLYRTLPRTFVDVIMGSSRYIQWTKLMFVCHRWFRVILGIPELWGYIYMDRSPLWIELTLSRSGMSPIDVISSDRPSCRPLSMLFPHAHRIRALYFTGLWGIDEDHRPQLAELLKNDMPALEVLEFAPEHSPSASRRPRLPELTWSSTSQPRLHTLVVDWTNAPQDHAMYSRLRKLSLSWCSYGASIDEFTNALAASVHLEELCLTSFLQNLSGLPGRTSAPPINLPQLRNFELYLHPQGLTSRFLARLTLPATKKFSVSVSIEDADIEEGLSASLPSNIDSVLPLLKTMDNVTLTCKEDYALEATKVYRNASGDSQLDAEETSVNLYLLCDAVDDWQNFIKLGLGDVTKVFRGAPLTSLNVCGGNHEETLSDDWVDVFSAFPLVVDLVVGGNGSPTDVFEALDPCAGPSFPLPRLKFLRLHDQVRGSNWVLDALLDCLRERECDGAVLENLELELVHTEYEDYWTMRRNYLPQFRKLVDDVSYDESFPE